MCVRVYEHCALPVKAIRGLVFSARSCHIIKKKYFATLCAFEDYQHEEYTCTGSYRSSRQFIERCKYSLDNLKNGKIAS